MNASRAFCIAWLVMALGGCARCTRTTLVVDAASAAVDAALDAPRDAQVDGSAALHVRVPTPEERTRYADAIVRGRAATVAKKYADAIAAFGEALTAIPSDARALSERGYARLLSGDNANAEKDFNTAIDAVPKSDRKLTAQIYYNLGLVAEKLGDSGSGAYFRSSYEYNATAAAKAKMSTCPVTIGGPFAIDSVSTLTEYVNTGSSGGGDTKRVLSEDENGGARLAAGDDDDSARALLPKSSGGYWRFDTNAKLQVMRSSICCFTRLMQDTVDIVRAGSIWIVTTQPMVEGITECPCGNCVDGTLVTDYVNGGQMKCEESGISNEKGHCVPCGGTIDRGVGVGPTLTPGGSREVFYVDATTGAALWDVSYDTEFDKAVKLAIDDGKLHVTGAGCDMSMPRP